MLIDTNALIWRGQKRSRLRDRAAQMIRQRGNFLNHVSLWEMAIKSSLGQLKLLTTGGGPSNTKQFMLRLVHALDLTVLPLECDDFTAIEHLPTHHKDPFDRLLVVQAKRRRLPIVSADRVFQSYGVQRFW